MNIIIVFCSLSLKTFLNIVFSTLNTQFVEVFYFSEKQECNFIVLKNKKVQLLVQVSWELNENNKAREIDGLLTAMNTFKQKTGLILTHEQEEEIQIEDKKKSSLNQYGNGSSKETLNNPQIDSIFFLVVTRTFFL